MHTSFVGLADITKLKYPKHIFNPLSLYPPVSRAGPDFLAGGVSSVFSD